MSFWPLKIGPIGPISLSATTKTTQELNFRVLRRNYMEQTLKKSKEEKNKGDFVERERFKVVLYLCRSTASCQA